MNRRIFVDMDGTLAEWKENESTDILYEKGYYEKLKPNEFLLNMVIIKHCLFLMVYQSLII